VPMLDHAALAHARAVELFEQEVARHEAALASLRARVAATGGDPGLLDASPESLVPLWRWYVGWFQAGHVEQSAGPLPPWFTRGDAPQEAEFADALFVVADELGHHLDEVALRTVPDAHWRLVGERDGVRYEDFHMTAVALGEADLVGPDLAWTMCLRVRRGRNLDERSLLDTFATRTAHLNLPSEERG
jgi:hypothetical protein